ALLQRDQDPVLRLRWADDGLMPDRRHLFNSQLGELVNDASRQGVDPDPALEVGDRLRLCWQRQANRVSEGSIRRHGRRCYCPPGWVPTPAERAVTALLRSDVS
ncbi:MAG: hypothetical protein AVDCRST_MAG75-350, partial [uncultured Propionibacteriaceae bacterium]